ncbi:RHS repeat-associated core domain containing protein [Nitzschia inconspicua]|uniref:RHS repeat-associated core domain containing protein n=1 Tax=Nitzschia inconspicua TaxID=303405 RepID=A0A9K3L054_9STRA|nr:RHS repeat-associated core domain containing protein [Nitzschia inconspicua]
MMNNDTARDAKHSSTRPDDRSATSSVTSAAASWLDERIAQERMGHTGIKGTSMADLEAKQKARSSASKSGTLRVPPKLRGSSSKDARRQASFRSGSNRQEESAVTFIPPRKPSRSNSKVNDSVHSALKDLEKDILHTLPNNSPESVFSPKSVNGNMEISLNKIQTTEQDIIAKTRAKTGTADFKHPASATIDQMEKDVAMKSKARNNVSTETATRRVTTLEADKEAKDRARFKPSGTTVAKRLNQLEADMATKQKAKANPSTSAVSKRLNQLEIDTEAKARARGSPSSVTSKALNQMEADVAAKAQARSEPKNISGSTKNPSVGGNVISSLSKDQDDIIAYKTGIALSEQPDDVRMVARPKGNPAEMISKGSHTHKEVCSLTKEGAVPQDRQYSTGFQKDYHFKVDEFSDDEEDGRLAVAVAVKEYEDEDVFIPSAIEYDPDAKPPMYKNRRFRMYGILGCILLIILLACAIGILAIQEKSNTTETLQIPTSAPTCERCSIGIEELLELEVGSEKLYDPSTSEFMAKEWIIHEDPLKLLPMDANLVQRFLLVTFYFETHQLGEWRSCNRHSNDDSDETCSFERIVNLYPLEYEGVPSIRWLSSEHECKWAGINCDELNQARIIDLPGQEIQGTFPAILTRLRYVQTITLAWNKFIGQLPDSIGNMKHLLNFEVQYNQFTGNIPLTWSNAKNLQLVNFGGNMLSGQLPTEVGYLRNIKGMFLYENMLTGTFPDEFAQVSLLTYARFQRNLMTGTIPTFLGDMRLNELWINRNPIQGTIPSELGKLSNHMFDLRLFASNLEGTIPEEIYDLTSLWRFDLYDANFTGTISSNVGNLQSLSVFRINNNSFTGTLPSELNSLSNLIEVQLDHNAFNGTVPVGMCDNLAPNGILEFLQADCLVDPTSGSSLVTCECCHKCCNSGWDECIDNF